MSSSIKTENISEADKLQVLTQDYTNEVGSNEMERVFSMESPKCNEHGEPVVFSETIDD